jgi:hypothetical protein
MSLETLLITAAKDQWRFASPKGDLALEDLFGLSLQSNTGKANLNDIAIGLHTEASASSQAISFVEPAIKNSDLPAQKLELVKMVIAIKVGERDAALAAKSKAEQRQKIMQLIEAKKNEAMAGQSLDELTAMLAAL